MAEARRQKALGQLRSVVGLQLFSKKLALKLVGGRAKSAQEENDAWAVARTVPHAEGALRLLQHEVQSGDLSSEEVAGVLADDHEAIHKEGLDAQDVLPDVAPERHEPLEANIPKCVRGMQRGGTGDRSKSSYQWASGVPAM